ncbi:MAG: hypothetical protein WB014_05240, partial [Methanosarcina sp.]
DPETDNLSEHSNVTILSVSKTCIKGTEKLWVFWLRVLEKQRLLWLLNSRNLMNMTLVGTLIYTRVKRQVPIILGPNPSKKGLKILKALGLSRYFV